MSPDLSACISTDPNLLGHCRRVAAVAQCIAHQLFLAAPVKVSVEWASLLHHSPIEALPHMEGEQGLVPGLWFEFEVVGSQSKLFDQMVDHFLKRDGIPVLAGQRRFWDFRVSAHPLVPLAPPPGRFL